MRKNRVGIILLSLIFVIAVFAVYQRQQVNASGDVLYSGQCGANAYWTLDEEGVLRISGTGPMYDYEWRNKETYSPWYAIQLGDEYYDPHLTDQVKSIVIEEGITVVGENAFRQCEKAESVVIPSTVTEIKYGGFWQCFKFKTLTIPGNVKILGTYAFSNCYSIESLTIEEGVEIIGDSAFNSCERIPEFNLPSTIKSIGPSAFGWCSNLKEITIPEGITKLEDHTFFLSQNLEKVTLPSTLKELGDGVFSDTGITSIVIPEGVTVIPEDCFNGCNKLESVTFLGQLTSIGDNAFRACTVLPSIDLPETLESIGTYVFAGCKALEEVELPSKITSIPNNAFDNSGIKSLKTNGTLTSIGYQAFNDCDEMTSIAIPEGVTTIGDEAFYSCNALKSITFPSTLTRVEFGTFSYCNYLQDIFCYADPSVFVWPGYGGINLGYAVPGGTLCHVPADKVDAYNECLVDVTRVKVLGDLIDLTLGEHLAGYSLSLDGSIGVNFYMFLDDDLAASNTAKMVFTVSSLDGDDVSTQEVSVKKALTKDLGGRVCYMFTCKVNAKEMTSRITAQIIDGEATGKTYEYSVGEYAKYILDHPATYDKEQGIVPYLLKYGAAAQKYFNYNTELYADEYLPETDRWIAVQNASRLSQYQFSGDVMIGDGIEFYRTNLSLKSEITMNLQFKGVPENAVFKLGNKTLRSITSGGITTVTVSGIAGHDVDSFFEVSIYDGDTCLGSVSYSPLAYCYSVLSRETTETRTYDLKVLVSMLYYYNEEADYYYAITHTVDDE